MGTAISTTYLVRKQCAHDERLKNSDERQNDSDVETVNTSDVAHAEEGKNKKEQKKVTSTKNVERQMLRFI